MDTSTSDPLSSPTFSATSPASSFYVVSSRSRSSTTSSQSLRSSDDDSDDEIVWSVSETSLSSSELSNSSLAPASDDDFVVLSRPRSPGTRTGLSTPGARTPNVDQDLASSLARISLVKAPSGHNADTDLKQTPKTRLRKPARVHGGPKAASQPPATRPESGEIKHRKKLQTAAARAIDSYPSPAPSPNFERPSASDTLKGSSLLISQTKVGKPKPKKGKKIATPGLGARPIVDDSEVAEGVSDKGDEPAPASIYEEAVKYITSFLSNPTANESFCHLTLLQSLIIELGLTTSLPRSLTAAKAVLKSRAFLNIREYLAVREQGQEALKRVMHPSRNALIKDIKKKRNPASLKWVKKKGLQVLLVSCYH